jgi:cobalt-zinc-cadmium efflux system outer membrane protein
MWMILTEVCLATGSFGQKPALTWQEVRDRFEASNPTLQAAQLSIAEARAQETTAYLRPNPEFALLTDGNQLAPSEGSWRPFAGTLFTPSVSYLHERHHKRELRRDSARQSTTVAESTYTDQKRTLLFNLRNAFVQLLQAHATLQNARENLGYWDHELDLNRTRFKVGDLSQMDLNRQELQRIQFESDLETATVNLRTAKIQLVTLLNDRTPIDQFDILGAYDFVEEILLPLDEFRRIALESRPDLAMAARNVELATIQHQLAIANGSTDPTFSMWYSHNSSFNNPFATNTIGGSVSIPLRIFDKNQGEKARTLIDIHRNERLRDTSQAQVLSDVDSAYTTLVSNLNLLRPYKTKYLPLATNVRDTAAFSYRQGGASLLEYLDSEKSYRDTRLAYLNLIGAYLTAAAQMNTAVGREVIPYR